LRSPPLVAENAASGGGPLGAAPAETGVIESEIHNQRIAVVDLASGAVRQVSPPDLNVYEYDWSPDSRSFAFTAAPGPADNNWWIAQLYTMSLDTSRPRSIFRPGVRQQLAAPRWSPDGRSIVFVCGLMSDEGFNGGDLFTIAADGGEARNRTQGRRSSPNWSMWLAPNRLLFTESVGGGSAISTLDLGSGRWEMLWKGDLGAHAGGHYATFSLARDGMTSAIIRRSWTEAPDVRAGPIGKWQRVTDLNAGLDPVWGEARNVEWKNGGLDVQGWLVFPRELDASKRYPMVVFVHGGPAGSKKPNWPDRFFDLTPLSAEGYFVFYPNPRGSYGQGEAFVEANVKDFGGGDLRDILAGVDHVVKTFPVDGSRVGVTGWSYDGFMSMFAVTQTNRFRAAVAGAGIANWQSYYGQNLIDRWMIPYFGASVYDDPAVYAKSSAINFIKRVKTPSLVLVGERDAECPSPQSYEFWHALKTLGVGTQLVVYAEEGHDFRKPENRRDAVRRTAAWFDRWLK
jgi:dipeptidyl aminopeptidase/acylaminoacyl peptidase